jgi:hypothetical protein
MLHLHSYPGIICGTLAPPDECTGLLASIITVGYLAFSVPALIAGVVVTHCRLPNTTYGYGLTVMALSALTVVALWYCRVRSAPAVKAARHPL